MKVSPAQERKGREDQGLAPQGVGLGVRDRNFLLRGRKRLCSGWRQRGQEIPGSVPCLGCWQGGKRLNRRGHGLRSNVHGEHPR